MIPVDIAAVRDELAAAGQSHVDAPPSGAPAVRLTGYREPPGAVYPPAFVVLDPDRIVYHSKLGRLDHLLIRARIVIAATIDTDTARPLDRLLNPDQLPATLRSHATEVWSQCAVLATSGPYTTYTTPGDHPKVVGLAAELEIRLGFD